MDRGIYETKSLDDFRGNAAGRAKESPDNIALYT